MQAHINYDQIRIQIGMESKEGWMHSRDGYLREGRALSPDGAVVADDGGGGEVLPGAVDVAHQVLVHVGLPRHFLLLPFSLPSLLLVVLCVCVCVVRFVLSLLFVGLEK